MKTVGAYEAKTNLGRLLDDVALGETVMITKHGVPVAKLVPAGPPSMSVDLAVRELAALRERIGPLGDLTIREMIEEGRRF
jgi:prevent-host-death family protein